MILKALAVLAACLTLWCAPAMAASQEKEAAAVAAADRWLKVVDNGNYAESWNEAADYFRATVRQEQWEQSLQSVRKPLGKVVSRKLKSKIYQTSLPGAPDGEYVVIQYQTSFQNKQSAVETVTPMKEKDGTWRVAGYFIK